MNQPTIDDCPDPEGDADRCETCEGWGHRCPAWRATHSADQIASVEYFYLSGWDPGRYYPSVEAAAEGHEAVGAERKRALLADLEGKP